MHLDEMYPSNTLKASDLSTGDKTATISHVAMEKLGDDTKPVVYFHNTEKRLVLNKTNARTIADIHGPDTDAWAGKQITLGHAWTDYSGKQVECIRVRPQIVTQAPAAQAAQAPMQQADATTAMPPQGGAPAAPGSGGLNDEVPF
jgi:hypothetical protein